MCQVRGGGGCGGNISLWEISGFKCVQNFPLNFQAAVQIHPVQNLATMFVVQLPSPSIVKQNCPAPPWVPVHVPMLLVQGHQGHGRMNAPNSPQAAQGRQAGWPPGMYPSAH